MTKYDEIMNEVKLSPEAKERIINNVADAAEDKGTVSYRKKRTSWKKYLTVAACCILVLAGAKAASDRGVFDDIFGGSSADIASEESNEYEAPEGISGEAAMDSPASAEPEYGEQNGMESKDAGVAWDAEFFENEEELSDFLGFPVSCRAFAEINLDKGMDTVTYLAISHEIGEISFDDGDAKNYFRKAEGTEDISGDYNQYEYMAEFDGEKCSGTFKGNSPDKYELAVWTSADGYTYAAYVTGGMSAAEWQEVIKETA